MAAKAAAARGMSEDREVILRRVASALDRTGRRASAAAEPVGPGGPGGSALARFVAQAKRNRAEVVRADDAAARALAESQRGRCAVRALAGIAEIGAVAIASDRVDFAEAMLAERLVVALSEHDVLETMDAFWPWLAARRSGPWPRAILWLAGPSRSADIEQTVALGAHGPARVTIALDAAARDARAGQGRRKEATRNIK